MEIVIDRLTDNYSGSLLITEIEFSTVSVSMVTRAAKIICMFSLFPIA